MRKELLPNEDNLDSLLESSLEGSPLLEEASVLLITSPCVEFIRRMMVWWQRSATCQDDWSTFNQGKEGAKGSLDDQKEKIGVYIFDILSHVII